MAIHNLVGTWVPKTIGESGKLTWTFSIDDSVESEQLVITFFLMSQKNNSLALKTLKEQLARSGLSWVNRSGERWIIDLTRARTEVHFLKKLTWLSEKCLVTPEVDLKKDGGYGAYFEQTEVVFAVLKDDLTPLPNDETPPDEYSDLSPVHLDALSRAMNTIVEHKELTDVFQIARTDFSKPKAWRLLHHLKSLAKSGSSGPFALIESIFDPVRFLDGGRDPEQARQSVNVILGRVGEGYAVGEDGKIRSLNQPPGSTALDEDGPLDAAEQKLFKEGLGALEIRIQELEKHAQLHSTVAATIRRKLRDVEMNMTKVSKSSIKDQLVGALVASTTGAVINRENFGAIGSTALEVLKKLL